MKERVRIKKIYLYEDNCSLRLAQVKDFIENTFKIPACVKKVKNAVVARGLVLDFMATRDNISYTQDKYYIIITNSLFATFSDMDKRIHLRSSLFSYPSIISLPGIVEAPAKPRGYYLAKQSLAHTGLWEIEEARIKKELKDRFIDYGDSRITEVLKGLVSQALFFYFTGEPFCKIRKCRLYNAHWQEELIHSQIKSGMFCARHGRILKKLAGRDNFSISLLKEG